MNFHRLISRVGHVVGDNSPVILSGVAVVGTLTTAYLTGKATFKAAEVIQEIYDIQIEKHGSAQRALDGGDVLPLSNRDKFELTWKLYIPAASTALLTVSCIVLANRVGSRRTAAMAAAYGLSERALTEYKEKVVEKIGEKKEKEIRDEISQDRVNRASSEKITIVTQDGKVMCHDAFSNQFFHSDMETLRKAQNDVNAQILHSDHATVSDFYSYVGSPELEDTSVSTQMGWNTDKTLELDFSTVFYKEKTPCISVNFATMPIPEPWRFV